MGVVISVKERAIVVVEGNNATVATVVVVVMEEAAAMGAAVVMEEEEEAIVATLEVPGNKKETKFQYYSVSYMFHIFPLISSFDYYYNIYTLLHLIPHDITQTYF